MFLYYMALFISICIDIYIKKFKFRVVIDELRTMVVKIHLWHICMLLTVCIFDYLPVPVSVWSNVWVCGCSLAGIVALNSGGGMDVRLL
jgi:hypothetical protein